jgi:hypothetical protein
MDLARARRATRNLTYDTGVNKGHDTGSNDE